MPLTSPDLNNASYIGFLSLTSENYVNAFLDHIKIREPDVGAWIYLDPELAIQQARQADQRQKDNKAGI
ncbi:hypothetical protein OAD30_04790, partial [Alphaproteobacteria bacterium]|nr:hypothetical protein [Alphaproteobacteria bacterium]